MYRLFSILKKMAEYISEIKTNGARLKQRTLLWTNPNPSSNFTSQKVSVNLNGYDEVEIKFTRASSSGIFTEIFNVGDNAYLWLTYDFIYRRTVTVATDGVTFGSGQYGASYPLASLTTNNNFMLPQKIYGIKYISI